MRDCKRDYICVIGSLNYDIIMKQKRMPFLGETYTADSITYSGGGKGANQAVQCAKLGIDTIMVGKVGRDSFGDTLVEKLRDYGVDCSCIGRSSSPTGVGVVHALEDGTVYASIITGANFDITAREIDGLDELVRNSRIIILQLEIPTNVVEHIIRKAKQYHVYTILNAAPAKELDREVLKLVDCLIVNETEASFYAGVDITDGEMVRAHADRLSQLTEGTVIVTLGSKGSMLLGKEETVSIEPVKVEHVTESTGAGDSYIGAFAYGKYKGMTDRRACCFAARAASVTVTKIGAQEAMPCLNEIDESLVPGV
ncbi:MULTISPECIES: ribokinase [unclassified Clostridium]|jgi:ribokinase|uniref:ribokinase n=1 Tax=unclassified Clostridium TaxID=2614128 RepID=UPI001106C677|nr:MULTISPECIES: ribokinase [unclassified Clostridium]